MLANNATTGDTDRILNLLHQRVVQLEAKYNPSNHNQSLSRALPTIAKPEQCDDEFPLYMYALAVSKGFKDTRFVRCPDDYYDRPLQYRRNILRAPHTNHMTKSIVIENIKKQNDYACCIIPYAYKLDINVLNSSNAVYKLADNCLQVTGYIPNAVTPLGLKTDMPVFLDSIIANLSPKEFWLGGGEISLKWNVQLSDFINAFNPIIKSISTPEE